MAMNLIARVIVIALVLIASSIGKPPVEKVCCLKEKTCHSSSCRGRLIALNVEMARVVEVEQGNFVYEFHYMQLRKRNNICSCPLPSHSSTLSNTSIPTRLYKVFDEAGRSIGSYIDQGRGGAQVVGEAPIKPLPHRPPNKSPSGDER